MARTTYPTSISLEGPLHQAAKEQARRNRQSLSAYIATLLERDLGLSNQPIGKVAREG